MRIGFRPLLAVALVCLFVGAVGPVGRVRLPIAAGIYYPANPEQLRAAIQQYLQEAKGLPMPGAVVGCIVPHSPYSAAGAVMGNAFRQLPRGAYHRVIVLAPATDAEFRGCSIPSVQFFRTPLGDVPLDGPAIRRVTVNTLIQLRSVVYREEAYSDPQIGRRALHEKETAVEVILPFLQETLGNFRIVPILVGELRRIHGGVDEHGIDSIVRTLRSIVDDKTLVVACSDFTRYGAVHNFTPFTSNVLEGIAELDMQAFRLIERRNAKGFYAYLDATQNNLSGAMPIAIAMRLMPRGSAGVLMGYEVTGRRTGNPSLSVSYASLVFVDGNRPPFPSSPNPVPTAALPAEAAPPRPPEPLLPAPPIVEAAPKGQTDAGVE